MATASALEAEATALKRRTVAEARYVYVAGAYSSEHPEEVSFNVRRAEQAGRDLLAKGHIPFVPHAHSHGWETDRRFDYEDFMALALAWLRKCDWLLYLGPSPGADRELAVARERGMPVFYSVDEVPIVGG